MDETQDRSLELGLHTPDSKELAEQTKCFECGVLVAPGDDRGLAVTEGIVLCRACCERRGGRYETHAGWTLQPWFEDLVGHGPHP